MLEKYFSRPARPKGALNYSETAGFLFAVVCCPELIMPSEWLELIFKGEADTSIEEGRQVTMAILSLYNMILEQVEGESMELPPGITVAAKPMANFETDAPLSQWSKGWITGHDWLYDVWDENLSEALDTELSSIMMILSFFSNPEVARKIHKEFTSGKESFEDMVGNMLELLPGAMYAYANMGRAIEVVRDEFGDSYEPPVKVVKVGRNEPCPCGSGVKYKKCCAAPGASPAPSRTGTGGSSKAEGVPVYELRVTLKNIKPPVWRTFAVPGSMKLNVLHDVLQTVMGWTDSHLHMFRSGRQIFELLREDGMDDFPSFGFDPPPPPMDEREVSLNEVLGKPGDKFTYLYDLGDSWEHTVKLEKIKLADPGTALPLCLKGKRSCPPEDIGGPWGYASFLEAIVNEDHPQHEELTDWLDGDFDPEYFDAKEVNQILKGFAGGARRLRLV